MIEFVVAGVAVVLVSLIWSKSRPRKFPPGPVSFPALGNLYWFLENSKFNERLERLHAKYGSVISLDLGQGAWDVWTSDFDMIKLVLQDPRFSYRTIPELFLDLKLDQGLAFDNGEKLRGKRKMMFHIMRSVGVGKTPFSRGVEAETEHLVQHLEKCEGKSVNIKVFLSYATNNLITHLLFNTRRSFEDEEFLKHHQDVERFLKLLNPISPSFILPAWMSRFLSDTKELIEVRYRIVNTQIRPAFLNRNPEVAGWAQPECISDHIWAIKDKLPFPEEEIPYLLNDMQIGGYDTTTQSMAWMVLELIRNPDIQESVYEELQRQFPDHGQTITQEEFAKIPYFRAAMSESQRLNPILLATLDHTANCSIENFHGYIIPKGTRMMASFRVVHRNPKYWEYPNEFNPKNFLDSEGNYKKSPFLIPWSMGTRSCLGENIARQELFVIMANLLRRFKLVAIGAPPEKVPNIGILVCPPEYEVKLEKRD